MKFILYLYYILYVIIKTMYSFSYHYSSFVATRAPGNVMYSYSLLLLMDQRVFNKLSKDRKISNPK